MDESELISSKMWKRDLPKTQTTWNFGQSPIFIFSLRRIFLIWVWRFLPKSVANEELPDNYLLVAFNINDEKINQTENLWEETMGLGLGILILGLKLLKQWTPWHGFGADFAGRFPVGAWISSLRIIEGSETPFEREHWSRFLSGESEKGKMMRSGEKSGNM